MAQFHLLEATLATLLLSVSFNLSTSLDDLIMNEGGQSSKIVKKMFRAIFYFKIAQWLNATLNKV